jgi:inner membrane transporter RhtA
VAALVAVAASVLPRLPNLEALHRIPPRVFGVLTSLEPAADALFELLGLGERLARSQWLGIAAVASTFLRAAEGRNSRLWARGEPVQRTGTTSAETDDVAVRAE